MNYLLMVLLSLSVLYACEQEDLQPQPAHQLIARAGADLQLAVGSVASLDGTASSDGGGRPFSFAWTLKSRPASSTASLNAPTSASPAFSPDVAGTYVVELKIENDRGFATDEVTITATAPEQPGEPQAVIINDDITEDRVLENIFTDAALADYIVTANVKVTARLTVKPGVKIAFMQDRGLSIYPQGALIAKGMNDGSGTTEQRISFTGTSSSKGFWKGILLMSSSPLNEISYASVEYAGSSPFAEMPVPIAANLSLLSTPATTAAAKISHTLFYQGAGYGLYVEGASSLQYFANNYFEHNSGPALYVPAGQLHKLDFFSHLSGNNGFNGVETGGTLSNTQAEVAWPDFNDGSAYLVSSDLVIESGLRIDPGATFEFKKGLALMVMEGGYMNASGTEANKITFTAHEKTEGGYWGGILFNSNSSFNELYQAALSYAGNRSLLYYPGYKASIAITTTGRASVVQTHLRHGLGWGLLAFTDKGAQVNADVAEANIFNDLAAGNTKLTSTETALQQLEGIWLDVESFTHALTFDALLYDQASNRWFGGAASPWNMSPRPGLGLQIDAEGNYLWTGAEQHHNGGTCGSPFSAEYIKGKINLQGEWITFTQTYWRSSYTNPCDATQNVDMEVPPGVSQLRYTVQRFYDMYTGAAFWELKLILSDGSILRYYKR